MKQVSLDDMHRVVVAIDPSGASGKNDEGRDEIGIIVGGLGADGNAYVIADLSCKLSPDGWGRRAVGAYHRYKADKIVAEQNFGGAMVMHALKTVDDKVPVKLVTASRGKVVRAEPISMLYEQGKVFHVDIFHELEEQLNQMTPSGYVGEGSPDRADALVWCLTELMLGGSTYSPYW